MVGSAGLTVSTLARRVGVGADTVCYYERARCWHRRSGRRRTTACMTSRLWIGCSSFGARSGLACGSGDQDAAGGRCRAASVRAGPSSCCVTTSPRSTGSSRLRSLRGELVAMVMSTSSWICGRNLASSYRCPVPVELRVGHDLGLRFPVLSAAPAGSSSIDSQVHVLVILLPSSRRTNAPANRRCLRDLGACS